MDLSGIPSENKNLILKLEWIILTESTHAGEALSAHFS